VPPEERCQLMNQAISLIDPTKAHFGSSVSWTAKRPRQMGQGDLAGHPVCDSHLLARLRLIAPASRLPGWRAAVIACHWGARDDRRHGKRSPGGGLERLRVRVAHFKTLLQVFASYRQVVPLRDAFPSRPRLRLPSAPKTTGAENTSTERLRARMLRDWITQWKTNLR
jgi:hypothetical protein